MTAEMVKEFKHISERILDSERKIDYLYSMLHKDNADQIGELQEYMIENEYEKTLDDLDV